MIIRSTIKTIIKRYCTRIWIHYRMVLGLTIVQNILKREHCMWIWRFRV